MINDRRVNLTDAAFALGSVAVDAARVPLDMVRWLPGLRRIALDGAFVRERVQSRAEGLAGAAVDRLLASSLPDAITRSALEHRLPERIAAARLDVETAGELHAAA
jgi:hypothetical protein